MTRAAASSRVPILLEPMQVEDLDAVLRIEHQSFSTPWSRTMFLTELANTRLSRLLVARAVESRAVVGYLAYRMVVDEMHIVLVAVDPEWRQRSVARQMLEHAMAQARQDGCRKATLEVRVSNVAAQRLYFQLGFAPVGSRPKYYRRPTEDALILWREPL